MRTKSISVLIFVICCFSSAVMGAGIVYYEDGNNHVINYSVNSIAYIDRYKAGLGTSLEIINGGRLNYGFVSFEDSKVTVNGGLITTDYAADARDRSSMDIYSGSIIKHVRAQDNAKINMYGGTINDSFNCSGDSVINVYGGTINGLYPRGRSVGMITGGNFNYAIDAFEESQLTISSVNITYDLTTEGNAKVDFKSGSIGRVLQAWENSDLVVSGGTIKNYMRAGHPTQFWDTSTLTLVGSNFAINGVPVSNGRYFASDYSSGLLSGTFASGESFSNSFYIYDAASIVLIPEPGTLLLLGLGITVLRRKK